MTTVWWLILKNRVFQMWNVLKWVVFVIKRSIFLLMKADIHANPSSYLLQCTDMKMHDLLSNHEVGITWTQGLLRKVYLTLKENVPCHPIETLKMVLGGFWPEAKVKGGGTPVLSIIGYIYILYNVHTSIWCLSGIFK